MPGRKSIRRISDHLVGRRAEQSLQQFVNQSPWRWDGVRSVLAHRALAIRPKAWIVQEAMFPKNGHNSVGVARQYAASAGRSLNCQLGMAIVLANGGDRCAVNWRLLLPRSWDNDPDRRTRARVPVEIRHRPRWWHVFDAIAEMTVDWGLRPAPIVWDAAGPEAPPLLRRLTARRLPYLVRVDERLRILPNATVGELAAVSARQRQVMLKVRAGSAGRLYSLLSLCDVCAPDGRVFRTSACRHGASQRVLAEWMSGPTAGRPRSVWLTNITTARLAQLVELIELSRTARQEDMVTMRDEFGLQDFEGRSYAGWHHHVTLVSAAHVYRTLGRRGRRQRSVKPRNETPGRSLSIVDERADDPPTLRMKECAR